MPFLYGLIVRVSWLHTANGYLRCISPGGEGGLVQKGWNFNW